VLPTEVILEKIKETVALGGDQILMQGGLHPTLPLEWYEDLLRTLKSHYPQVNLHAFSPPEIYHFAQLSKAPVKHWSDWRRAQQPARQRWGNSVDRVRKLITRGVLTDI
jgi:cyclic dehypoxanthinyl futalosine synthase